MLHYDGDFAGVRRLLEESLTAWRDRADSDPGTGTGMGLGPSRSALGYLALDQGDLARARAVFEERRRLWERTGAWGAKPLV